MNGRTILRVTACALMLATTYDAKADDRVDGLIREVVAKPRLCVL